MAQPSNDDLNPVGRKSTINLENYSKTTQETYQSLMQLGEQIIGEGSAVFHAGSGSISVANKVIAKVMPQLQDGKELLLLGISTDYSPQTWTLDLPTFDGPFLVRDSLFHFFELATDTNQAIEQATQAFRELKTRL